MRLATYKDLCIDVADARVEGTFWAAALGWRLEMHDDGDAHLRDSDGRIQVWLNRVPEPKTVKNRVHIDVRAASVDEVLALGARVLYEEERWTTFADPEGHELCVFVREEPITQRPYELIWDCAEGAQASHDIAAWWAEVVGGVVGDHDEHEFSWIEQIPDCPWESFDWVGVPEPKTVKNRVHIDVTTDDLDALVAHGATVLRAKGDGGLRWTVLADPDGNEFCAFIRLTAQGVWRSRTDRQVTQPSSFSYSLRSTATTRSPRSSSSAPLCGALGAHQHQVVAQQDDVRAGLLGHGEERRPHALVVDERRVADDGAVRQRGDRRLQVQHLLDRYGDHPGAVRLEVRRQLVDAGLVGPAAEPDPDGAVVLEHVAAVEGARRLDLHHVVPEAAEHRRPSRPSRACARRHPVA